MKALATLGIFQQERHRHLWIPLLYGAILLSLASAHSLFSEWTGVMEYFSGKELVAGGGYQGWASAFYPPFFPLLSGLVGHFCGGFFAGKLISIVSSSLLLWVAYELTAELCERGTVCLWTQVFLALSPVYLWESLQADNHMLDAFLFNCGLLLFLRSLREPQFGRLFLAGVVCGLSGLTRYNSYVLLVLPLSFLGSQQSRKVARLAAFFVVGFGVVSLPWWYYNAKCNGSPLHNLQYLNVMMGVAGRDISSHILLWHWMADPSINGLTSIIVNDPLAYLRNILRNIPHCMNLLFTMAGSLALFVVPGILESILRLRSSQSIAAFGALAISVLAVSQAYVNHYMLLPWSPLIVAVSVAFLLSYLSKLEDGFLRLRRFHAGRLLVAFLLLVGWRLSVHALADYRQQRVSYRPLVDLDEITIALTKHDPDIETKVIMAIDPARAYYAGARYLSTPLMYSGSVDGLVCYRNVSQRLRHFAPRYPSDMDDSSLKADYLVYTRQDEDQPWLLHDPIEFAFLLDPGSSQIPKSFRLVYHSANAAVYEVDWTQPLIVASCREDSNS